MRDEARTTLNDEGRTTLRVFCAIELPAEIRSRVAERVRRLREEFADVRASWEKAEKLHITLKFLGELERERVEALSDAAAEAAARVEPFELEVCEPGSFPPKGQPRVLWLGIRDDSGRLAFMQSALEDACASAGFEREPRPFKPHQIGRAHV